LIAAICGEAFANGDHKARDLNRHGLSSGRDACKNTQSVVKSPVPGTVQGIAAVVFFLKGFCLAFFFFSGLYSVDKKHHKFWIGPDKDSDTPRLVRRETLVIFVVFTFVLPLIYVFKNQAVAASRLESSPSLSSQVLFSIALSAAADAPLAASSRSTPQLAQEFRLPLRVRKDGFLKFIRSVFAEDVCGNFFFCCFRVVAVLLRIYVCIFLQDKPAEDVVLALKPTLVLTQSLQQKIPWFTPSNLKKYLSAAMFFAGSLQPAAKGNLNYVAVGQTTALQVRLFFPSHMLPSLCLCVNADRSRMLFESRIVFLRRSGLLLSLPTRLLFTNFSLRGSTFIVWINTLWLSWRKYATLLTNMVAIHRFTRLWRLFFRCYNHKQRFITIFVVSFSVLVPAFVCLCLMGSMCFFKGEIDPLRGLVLRYFAALLVVRSGDGCYQLNSPGHLEIAAAAVLFGLRSFAGSHMKQRDLTNLECLPRSALLLGLVAFKGNFHRYKVSSDKQVFSPSSSLLELFYLHFDSPLLSKDSAVSLHFDYQTGSYNGAVVTSQVDHIDHVIVLADVAMWAIQSLDEVSFVFYS